MQSTVVFPNSSCAIGDLAVVCGLGHDPSKHTAALERCVAVQSSFDVLQSCCGVVYLQTVGKQHGCKAIIDDVANCCVVQLLYMWLILLYL